MTKLQQTSLADIGKVLMCKRVLKHQTSDYGEIPFFKISTFGGEPDTFIPKELYDNFRKKYSYPKKGDILISAAGTVGKTVVFDGRPAYFQDSNIVWIDNDESKIINNYLYYFYQTKPWVTTDGSTIKRIYNENLRSIKISFPEITEQQKISAVLSALDAKIELNNKINAELEAMAKTLYDYWFVQFDFPDKNGKPYKTSGGKMVWSEELKRDIPEGWKVDTLGNACDIYQPQTISDKDCIQNGKYFVHGSNGIIGKYDKFNHEESEIIVSCRGDCGNIHRTLPKMWITGNAMVFKMKDKTINNEFLYQALQYSGIKNISSGSVQGQITRTNVSPLKIIIPEKIITDKFSEISKNIVAKKLLIQEENQKLAELRDWLLPMLMNGQVKVA